MSSKQIYSEDSGGVGKNQPFLSFYKENNIIPVRQDVSDWQKHSDRRTSLYLSLGIAPLTFRNADVVEFGPGTGHNAQHLLTQGLRSLTLVDANPSSLAACRGNLAAAEHNVAIVESTIEDFETDRVFDIVLCEGVLPGQTHPKAMTQKLASFVRPGGMLVVTTADYVSALADIMRRALARMAYGDASGVDEKLKVLRPIFTPTLESLSGVSRLVDDWILDNVIQPLYGGAFSIIDAIDALDETDLHPAGSSPRFGSDWRWYKNIYRPSLEYRTLFRESYWENVHNFIDCRSNFPPQDMSRNRKLYELCEKIVRLSLEFQYGGDFEKLISLRQTLRALITEVEFFSRQTSVALRDFTDLIGKFLNRNEVDFVYDQGSFLPFFGRGQQYVSFVRWPV